MMILPIRLLELPYPRSQAPALAPTPRSIVKLITYIFRSNIFTNYLALLLHRVDFLYNSNLRLCRLGRLSGDGPGLERLPLIGTFGYEETS